MENIVLSDIYYLKKGKVMSLTSVLKKVVAIVTGKPAQTDQPDNTPMDQTDETPVEHPAEQVHNAEFYQEQETH